MCTEFCIPFFDAKYGIYKTALNVCKKDEFSYIIATGEPFILFKYASKISRKTAVPWIADYRDGWSTNYNYSAFQRMFFSGIEKCVIRSCSCITTVSEEFQQQCAERHNKQVYVVMNGFEPIAENFTQNRQSSEHFCMSFAGTLYPYQQIEMCADALRMCKKEVLNTMKIQWIGLNFYPEQKQRIRNLFSEILVHQVFTDRIPQKDVISLLHKSSVLLLPASDIKKQVYAKVFDYLQVQRTIFLFPSDNGTLQEIIDNTSSGLSFAHAEDLHKGFMAAFDEWKQNGFVESQTHTIEQYSRKNQAHKFVQILQDMN
jgi:glycosyltransferase involved in cell wall biosynthesis